MRRRDLLKVAGASALALAVPGVAVGQGRGIPVIWALVPGMLDASFAAIRDGLAEEGWVLGENAELQIVVHNDPHTFQAAVDEAAAAAPDVIWAVGPWRSQMVLAATSSIPLVFTHVDDALALGLVDNVARPGGNATGFQYFDNRTQALQILVEAVPDIERLAYVRMAGDYPWVQPIVNGMRALGFDPLEIVIGDVADFAEAIRQLADLPRAALFVDGVGDFWANRPTIIAAVNEIGVPATYVWAEFAREGGLMAFGHDTIVHNRFAGRYIGRILNGVAIADLPVQAPDDTILVLNVATATAQGITFPSSLLAIASEIVE